MNKLKNKVLFTIFTILSVSIIFIILIFNIQEYVRTSNSIKDNLNMVIMDERFHEDDDKREIRRFMDNKVYTVYYSGTTYEITSHYTDDTVSEEIHTLVKELLNNKKENGVYLNNLYTSKYSYRIRNNMITIIDNSSVNKRLQVSLYTSLLILIILEIVSYCVSSLLSKWIIKPVEASFKKQKEFIADASHELKTPLAVIIASSENYEIDNDKKWINNIKDESEKMNKLIKDLLDLAKLENDDIKKVYENINLSRVIEKSILPFESLVFEKGKELNYDIEENITMLANETEIKQLLGILLDNAIKHSDKEINVNFKSNKDDIILEVINSGDPIKEEDREKIFERFYRIDKSRNRNENRYGLGLAIAKSICERHNATIKAISKDGYTTFKVNFKRK